MREFFIYFFKVESRTQGSRPSTQKKSEAKDSLFDPLEAKDTAASVLQKKKGLRKSF